MIFFAGIVVGAILMFGYMCKYGQPWIDEGKDD